MRKFFVTDLHGEYEGFLQLLEYVAFEPAADQLVVGGDMIDRGNDSAKVVKYIKALQDRHPERIRVVIGNHEEMALWYRDGIHPMWLEHGGKETQSSFKREFSSLSIRGQETYWNWIRQLPLWVEDDEFVYCHAGIDPYVSLANQHRDVLWMIESDLYELPREDLLHCTNGKPIVHGHTPVERIYYDGARINGDMGSHSYSIVEERGLGLIELSRMVYHVYKPFTNKITTLPIQRYGG